MLDRTDFASWQQRIRLYCRGKENGVNILKSIDEGPFQIGTIREPLAEGTEGAPHLGLERPRVYSDLSPEEKDRGGGAARFGGVQNRVGNANLGQARQVKCYNCKDIGHIARNCTQPKHPQNSDYYKDKMLLMQAQENGVALDEEQLLFLAGGQDTAIDEDVDEQPVQDLALNVDNVFQADDYDWEHITGSGKTALEVGMDQTFNSQQPRVYFDLSPEEKDRYNANIRATNILLQGLPKDIYTLINHYTDAKDIWDNVKMLLEGLELTKKDRESQLVVVQNVQNRGQGTNPRGGGAAGFGGVQNRFGNANPADDYDAFDFNVDEAPTAQTMFMANLSSTDPVNDEAGPSYDSDILSEVHDHAHYQDTVCAHHEEHAMHDNVQLNHVVYSHANYTSDSNMILYDQKLDEIERKNLLIANDNLITECLSKEVFFVATNSELNVARFTKMHVAHTIVETRCLELEAELSNLRDKSYNDNHDELVKRFYNLDVQHLNLQLKYQNHKDSFGNNPPTPDKHTLDFDSVFVIRKMQASLQGKDNVIKKLQK
nr:retrovirus-related Pol polyprotein from transposon TNT 1-94 [Tanacetum cinerariifolium]